MKSIKKIFALLLACVMVMGLSVTAFAQDVAVNNDTTDNGTITITNTTQGQTYKLYKIFDATYNGTGDTANVSYTYTCKDTANDSLYQALVGTGTPFTLTPSASDSTVYVVTLKADYAVVTEASGDEPATYRTATDDEIIAFIEGIADKLTVLNTTVANEDGTIKYTGLAYGYYYITSTLGTLVTIDSAIPSVNIVDKNTAPSNEKTVEEDSNKQYGSSNTADLGDTVNFKSTITAYAGALNYVLHDTMSSGLTFNSTSVKVEVVDESGNVTKTLTAGTDYTLVTTGLTDGCTFEVKFTDTYLNSITAKTIIVVSYSATVNEQAVIGDAGNSNKSSLQYSNADETTKTPDSTTTTYVYAFDLLKYSGTDTENNKITLDGAEFTLTRSGETEALYFVKSTKTVDEETVTVYTLADSTTEGASQTITAGKITIEGLDAGEYTLTETKAPDGYNMLTKSITVVIGQSTENNTTTMTLTQDGEPATEIEVLNQSGTELPYTGGIGTTIFYVVGTILVLGAAILLITKKRMSNVQ